MKTITGVFIRHGFSQANQALRIAGVTDIDLTIPGIEELEVIKEKQLFPATDLYFCSPMKRTRTTFKTLLGEKDHTVFLDEFKELDFGDLEWELFEKADLPDLFSKWYDNQTRDNVENQVDFTQRITAGLNEILTTCTNDDAQSFTLVSHSCVMRQIIHIFQPLTKEEFLNYHIANGHGFIAQITYDETNNQITKTSLQYV